MLSPFAPHLCEELWELNSYGGQVCLQSWPEYDESKTVAVTARMAVQVGGKLKANIVVPTGCGDQAVVDACAAYIESRRPVGADVTVASAQAVEVDIAVHAVLEPGADPETVRAAFVAALDGCLRELAFEQYTVYANRVGALLMGVDGVRDYTGLAINGSGENLILDGDEVPIPGKVTVV